MAQCSLDPVWLVVLPVRDHGMEGKSVFDSRTGLYWPNANLEPHLLTGTETDTAKSIRDSSNSLRLVQRAVSNTRPPQQAPNTYV